MSYREREGRHPLFRLTGVLALGLLYLAGCLPGTAAATARPTATEIPPVVARAVEIYEGSLPGPAGVLREGFRVTTARSGTVVLNYTGVEVDLDPLSRVIAFFEAQEGAQFASQEGGVQFGWSLRPGTERVLAVIGADQPRPTWAESPSAGSYEETADGPYVSYVVLTDPAAFTPSAMVKTALDSDNRSVATEFCQTTVVSWAELPGKGREEEAVTWANWFQELSCNSYALAWIMAVNGVSYSGYEQAAGVTSLVSPGGKVPVLAVNEVTYGEMSQMAPVLTEGVK